MSKNKFLGALAVAAAIALVIPDVPATAERPGRIKPIDRGTVVRPEDRTVRPEPSVSPPRPSGFICGEPLDDAPEPTIRREGAPGSTLRRGHATGAAPRLRPRPPVFESPVAGLGPCAEKRMVRTPDELVATLEQGFTGCIIIPRNAFFNMTGRMNIPIPSGVSLIGERGELCSRPVLYTDTERTVKYALFEIAGNNVRISGLRFRGPAKGDRTRVSDERPYVDGIQITVDPNQGLGRGIVITDNEFHEWIGSGVGVGSTNAASSLDEYLPEWAVLTRNDASQVQITRNFFHHNAAESGGYGVTVGRGAYALIEDNVFDFNRHAVASDGRVHSGYIARHNYVLEGGFVYGRSYAQHFDVHGRGSGGYGGIAGTYFEIAFNTVRGAQSYYLVKTRPALMLRGTPTIGAYFFGNVLQHEDLDAAVTLKASKNATGIGEDHEEFNFEANGNTFNTDNSHRLGTGDFDGDGRTDVFITTGTAWFFSRAGSEPWEFLRASTKLIGELGLADIDNDRVTDVLFRDGGGNVLYLKSGRLNPVALTASPVAVKDLRFGDFDGDGLTDIFLTRNGQWQVWYGRTRAWTPTQTSSFPVGAFLFGEFDDVRGTDVVAVTGGLWQYSSGSTGSWTRLNDRLLRDFRYAVAADFDGDGKTDIAYTDENRQAWYHSPGGRLPFRVLREADGMVPYPNLNRLLIGRFEGDARPEVISYWRPIGANEGPLKNHFVIWREGVRADFAEYSREAMR